MTDGKGNPVNGAYLNIGDSSYTFWRSTQTNASGTYAFADVPEGKYKILVRIRKKDTESFYESDMKEIDFLKDFIPVEVKFKSKIEKDDIKWINYFTQKYGKKYNIKKAYVITKDYEGNINGVNLMPLWKLCFLGI